MEYFSEKVCMMTQIFIEDDRLDIKLEMTMVEKDHDISIPSMTMKKKGSRMVSPSLFEKSTRVCTT